MFHWFTSRQKRARLTNRVKPRRSTPLTLEALEARAVPAVFTVNTLADVLGGQTLSLRQAILDSNLTGGPNTINLAVAGTYQLTRFGNAHDGTNGALQITNQNLTINGMGAAKTIIDGGGVDRVFDIEGAINVAFNGVTIQHGLANSNGNMGSDQNGNASDGGGIYSPLANLTLTNAAVVNNLAEDEGGGIWTDTGNVTITGGAVSQNGADDQGGALFTNRGAITVTGATFANNVADDEGAAIIIDASTSTGNLIIVNSTFIGNSADEEGGAITDFSTVNRVSITGTTITDNTADDEGGGLFVEAATLTIDHSTISHNTADSDGGGIEDDFNATQVLSITNSTIDGNTTDDDGGGIESNAATATFINDSFSHNVAEDSAGIDFFGTHLTISNSHIDGNRAESSEGGIKVFNTTNGSSCTIVNSTLDNNHAGSEEAGGLIECITLSISQSSIDGNRSGSSIGGLEVEVTTATFTNVNVIGNFAGSSEGGLELEETNLTMTGCNISNNQAGSSEAGLFADGAATISNTIISGNRAGSSEGGLEFDGVQLNLCNDTISNNYATDDDGGIFDESSNGGTISNTTISGNWTGGDAGGIETDITSGTLTITGSTLSDNHAGLDGGAMLVDSAGTVTLTNDTLFGNTAAVNGGAIAHEFRAGTLNLLNVTIDGNAAANGGGVFSTQGNNVHSTIIAGNAANANKGPDVNGAFNSQGFNLIGVEDAASNSFTNGAKNDQVGSTASPLNARLGKLQNNGGPTFTQALLPGSPAIAKGDSNGAPSTDQRGFNRPATPSIGAYEPQFAANASANQVFVENLFEALLNRPADASSAGLVNELNAGIAPATVALQIEGSLEYRANQVKALFQHYLHRDADAAALQGFANFLGNGGTLEQVASSLLGSQEYFNLHGGTNDSFLYAMYLDVLGRVVDPGALSGFGQALAGGAARGQIASVILSSGEYQNNLVQADFQAALGRQADSAAIAFFVSELQHGASDQLVMAQILGSAEAFMRRS